MATQIASLFAEIKADTTHLERGLRETNQRLKKTKGRSDKAASSVSKFGTAAKLAAAAGVSILAASIGSFLRSSVEAASAVEEMSSKFSVVFGKETVRATARIENFADRVNRSKFELMGMASSLQDTFVPMGFARDEATDLSLKLTELAVDVGSFNDVADASVARDFQSALVGNHETVRKYGIIITEATLKQEAYRSGIAELGAELSDQEKVQARLNLLFAGTSDAQGDAAKTADSFANTMRGLKASVEEVQVAFGQQLLPTIQKVLPVLQDLADAQADAGQQAVEAAERGREANRLIAAGRLEREQLVDIMRDVRAGNISAAEAQERYNEAIEEARAPLEAFAESQFEVEDAARRAAIAAGDFAVVARDMSTMTDLAFEVRSDEEGNLEATETRMSRIVGLLERMQELQSGGREAVVESVDASQFEGQEQKLASLVQGDTFTAEGTLGSSIAEGAQRIREDLNPALADAQTATGNVVSEAAGMFADPLQDMKDIKAEVEDLDGRTITVTLNVEGGIPEFQTGGIVPGAIGEPQLVMAHGGEEVRPHASTNADREGGGRSLSIGEVNINSGMDERSFDLMMRKWLGA